MQSIVGWARSGLFQLVGVALLTLLPWSAEAAPFSTDGITLDIPVGFEGPVTQNGPDTRAFAFTKQSLAPSVRTLLQISIFDAPSGSIPPTLTKDELSKGSEKYVLDMLKGVERRRTEFKQSTVTHLLLGGTHASKVEWKGRLDGVATNGVMYCVIARGKVVWFHTQDSTNEVTSNMKEAIKAIEGLQIKS